MRRALTILQRRETMRKLALVALVAVAIMAMGATIPYYAVKQQMNDAADLLKASANRYSQASQAVVVADNSLGAMATTYADLTETVGAYGTADAAEAHAKAELAKLLAERTAIKAKTDAAKAAFTAIETHGAAAVKAKLAELD